MKCESCGAPVMSLGRSGRYFCDYCDTEAVVTPLDESLDGLVLTGTFSETPCLTCGDTHLEIGSLDRHAIKGCRRCQGILISRSSFALLVHERRAAYGGADITPEFDPALDGPRDHHSRLMCPNCCVPMDSFFYAGPGRVAIDSCDRCERVWLDCGEITAITEAPGRR
ncbi:zf-TFIIB domain-containing protein [Aporhodopirellula aestuarii]|uniref:Zf-TFIIB domain-containing protein n=1 Tax=Aporhodopirellula aestuarii TaxID=2950107 RepID=A0ABT0TXJ5_9BACT|nr:zf-TFIIB domain-containing protein [Aporhodopirellula aestuarii]MCM2369316.1 zf-TFIIB domain-containing protein [Aporhodopirellula aestuarii]